MALQTRTILNADGTGFLANPVKVTPGTQYSIGIKPDGGTYDVYIGLDPADPTDLILFESGVTADYVKSTLTGFAWISVNVTVVPTTSAELQVLSCRT
jgi:hypothetical protein